MFVVLIDSTKRSWNFHAGFTVLIPDYYRGETAEKHFMTGTLPKFIKQQTVWENLARS